MLTMANVSGNRILQRLSMTCTLRSCSVNNLTFSRRLFNCFCKYLVFKSLLSVSSMSLQDSSRCKKKTRIVQGNFYELHALTGDTYEARVALPLPSLSFWLTLPLLSCLATSTVHEWTIFHISVGTRTVIGQLSRPYFTLYGQWSQRFCFCQFVTEEHSKAFDHVCFLLNEFFWQLTKPRFWTPCV